ncbi:MAG: SDR family oxidoreductase [Candidatus Omnitrophota bacterium]
MTDRDKKPVALITGAAKRLGREMALHLAERGYSIALHYHSSSQQAARTAQQIKKGGGDCHLFMCDLAQADDTLNLIPKVIRQYRRLDLLINNASIYRPSSLTIDSLPELEQNFAVHLRAPYILSAAFSEQQKKGIIINMLDSNMDKTRTDYIPYLLSKRSLAELTRLCAAALGPNFRVNGICPGAILPPPGKRRSYLKEAAKNTPLGKPGQPANIMAALDCLLDNPFITGECLFVDGGLSVSA